MQNESVNYDYNSDDSYERVKEVINSSKLGLPNRRKDAYSSLESPNKTERMREHSPEDKSVLHRTVMNELFELTEKHKAAGDVQRYLEANKEILLTGKMS